MRVGSAAVVLALGAACGPSRDDAPRQTCGDDEPVQLVAASDARFVDDPVFYWLSVVGDHVIASGFGGPPLEPTSFFALTVDECGGPITEVFPSSPTEEAIVGSAGPWAVASDREYEDVRWLDPEGIAPSHPIFPSVRGCLFSIADGLAAVGADGILWFHPDPADPDASPRPLATGVIVPEHTSFFAGDLTDCIAVDDGENPVPDGDGLLVVIQDGPLVRVSIPSGDRETLVAGPVTEFVVLDDPRYILWGAEGECCELNVLDRATGQSVPFASGQIPGDVAWDGHWLSTFDLSPVLTEEFMNVATGVSFEIDDWWQLEASLDDRRMLVSRVGEDAGTYILDVESRTPTPLDFPRPDWEPPQYEDGVVGLRRPPDADVGTLELLPFDGGPSEVLAENVDSAYVRTRSGTLVYVERENTDAETGTLVYVTRGGERHVIAADVYGFELPFYGTDREIEDILFGVRHPERGGLWRFVLP